MKTAEGLITDNLDLWSSTVTKRGSQGRGSSKKIKFYGIDKLRDLILELAAKGMLVTQNSKDEPAENLIDRIRLDRKHKHSKSKKSKLMPEVDPDLDLFEIPIGWTWALIPQVIQDHKYAIKRGPFGSSIKKAYFVPSGYKVYEQQHAINNDFSLGEYYVNEEKFRELSAFEVKPNDIIISCSGTVGKVAVAPEGMERGIINQALLKICLNEDVLLNSYFKILFPAFYMKTETLSDLKGTAQKNMASVDTLKKEPFPLPPLDEQTRIVEKFEELMILCDQLEQQQENSITAHQTLVETLLSALTSAGEKGEFNQAWSRIAEHFDTLFTTEHSIDQLKQTILQLAVMGKLVPQDPSDEPASVLLAKIFEEKESLIKNKIINKEKPFPPVSKEEEHFPLPSGWSYVRLGSVCSKMGSGSTPRGGKSAYVDSGVPFLRSQNVWNDGLRMDDIAYITHETHEKMRSTHVYPGDVLLNITGASLGRSVIFPQSIETANVSQHVTIIRLVEKQMGNFIHLGILSPLVQQLVWGRQVGMAIEGLSKKVLEQFEFPIPPLSEQKRIVAKVDELMLLCDQLKERIFLSKNTQLQLADTLVEGSST